MPLGISEKNMSLVFSYPIAILDNVLHNMDLLIVNCYAIWMSLFSKATSKSEHDI